VSHLEEILKQLIVSQTQLLVDLTNHREAVDQEYIQPVVEKVIDNSRKSKYSKTEIVESLKELPMPPYLQWIREEEYEEDISQLME